MMIDYPVNFEIHIVKSEFQKVFGAGSHPDPHDYLYFGTYMNKMYMVDSVSDPDDFGYVASYWRVSLVPYQEMKSVQFDNDNLLDETESLIFSAEKKFEEEVKEEFKQMEGDPQIKGKIKQKQREMAMARMMQEVPKADVIVTNPTHFAVALRYSDGMRAPEVIAKGQDLVALRIKDVARKAGVVIVENKPLARALYAAVEIGGTVPPELYKAVAEVLAYVYHLKHPYRYAG